MSVILNTTIPSSMLKKKHLGCSYHRVREAIAAEIVTFSHVTSENNFADILTKPLPSHLHSPLIKKLLFRRADVIEKVAVVEKQVKMVTRIPTDQEQDEEDLRRRCMQLQVQFNYRRDLAINQRKYTEYRETMLEPLMEIRSVWSGDHPTNPSSDDSWTVRLESFEFDEARILSLSQAKAEFPRACILLALEKALPARFPEVWGWVADSSSCYLPLDEYTGDERDETVRTGENNA